ncbi:MAG: hypothetical protein WA906_04000, partial [Pacificimonas sp.]
MDVSFAPLIPWPGLAAVGALFALAIALQANRRGWRVWPRVLAVFCLILALANPVTTRTVREAVPDIGLVVVDRSESMTLGDRTVDADAALGALTENAGVEWSIAEVSPTADSPTALGAAMADAVKDIEQSRLGGIVLITDGIADDVTAKPELSPDVPVHLLIAGDPDAPDRRLIIESVPPYTVAGTTAELGVRVEAEDTERLTLTIETAQGTMFRREVPVGETVPIAVPVARRGPLDILVSVPTAPGEITDINNQATARLNGIRDRLSVLLVSGIPYPGGRVWRDLFKADPNVDLIHFTILRLPESFDPTPPDDLALIPFPVDELFEERLGDFDLVILDRFDLTQLMAPQYFGFLADRVREGGGLLVVAGPEYDGFRSIANTALAPVLPALPAGSGTALPFRPALTDEGARHPVTSVLPRSWGGTDWGRWRTMASLAPQDAQILMTGTDQRPLILLKREGEGRVGMIASTDIWWW